MTDLGPGNVGFVSPLQACQGLERKSNPSRPYPAQSRTACLPNYFGRQIRARGWISQLPQFNLSPDALPIILLLCFIVRPKKNGSYFPSDGPLFWSELNTSRGQELTAPSSEPLPESLAETLSDSIPAGGCCWPLEPNNKLFVWSGNVCLLLLAKE